jgi:hypothetical protein
MNTNEHKDKEGKQTCGVSAGEVIVIGIRGSARKIGRVDVLEFLIGAKRRLP